MQTFLNETPFTHIKPRPVAGFFVYRHLGVAGRNIGCMRGKK